MWSTDTHIDGFYRAKSLDPAVAGNRATNCNPSATTSSAYRLLDGVDAVQVAPIFLAEEETAMHGRKAWDDHIVEFDLERAAFRRPRVSASTAEKDCGAVIDRFERPRA